MRTVWRRTDNQLLPMESIARDTALFGITEHGDTDALPTEWAEIWSSKKPTGRLCWQNFISAVKLKMCVELCKMLVVSCSFSVLPLMQDKYMVQQSVPVTFYQFWHQSGNSQFQIRSYYQMSSENPLHLRILRLLNAATPIMFSVCSFFILPRHSVRLPCQSCAYISTHF